MRKVRVVEEDTIVIPELENAPDRESRWRGWSEHDVAILRKYWHVKPDKIVAKVLGRTVAACRVKFQKLQEEL
jgi:hypothetical protein